MVSGWGGGTNTRATNKAEGRGKEGGGIIIYPENLLNQLWGAEEDDHYRREKASREYGGHRGNVTTLQYA